MQIFCFGDSITYGFWDRDGGWVGRLRRYLDDRALSESTTENLNTTNYITVYNMGIPGEMSTGLSERVRCEYEARINSEQESVFIIAIGINDSHYNSEAEGYGVSIEEYLQNLKQILEFAKGYSKKVVFVGLTPVNEERMNPVFWQPQNSYKNEDIKKYDQALKEFTEKEKIGFVEIFNQMSEMGIAKLMEDGIHPNSEGHKVIYESISQYLISENII